MMLGKIGLNELKPCPFCGAGAIFEEHSDEIATNFLIRCGRCGCVLSSSNKVLLSNKNYKTEKEKLLKEMTEAWNERI